MSPRPYRMGLREAAVEGTRTRVLEAARKVLTGGEASEAFSIDAVAREAGVARMTVYYQFESKRGLLEAVFDDLAARGGIDRLAGAFRQPEPREALAEFIRVFSRFWSSGRRVIRRLHGLGATDPELDEALRTRSERRRHGLKVIVQRIAEKGLLSESPSREDIVDVLFALTSFETFDALARGKRRPQDVAALIQRIALATLDVTE